MHDNKAVNKVTGEAIPCLKDGDKLYHYAGEDSEPVELGDQWYIPKESILMPAIFVLMMISGLALLLWRATNII